MLGAALFVLADGAAAHAVTVTAFLAAAVLAFTAIGPDLLAA